MTGMADADADCGSGHHVGASTSGAGQVMGHTPAGEAVTIALPVFNGEAYLREALDSALAQTYPNVTVIVFDNASTDATRSIVESYGSAVLLRTAPINHGAAWNFNRAVAHCTTPFFMWLAADDALRPTYVEECVRALVARPRAHFALTNIEYINQEGAHVRTFTESGGLASASPARRFRDYLNRPRWTEVYSLYRTSSLRKTSLFRPVLGCDVLLLWELLLPGPAVLVQQPLLTYREYSSKTVQQMAESVTARAEAPMWPKVALWRDLWRLAGSAPVPAATRRAARRELLLVLGRRTWMLHLLEDLRGEAARPGSSFVTRATAALLTRMAQNVVRRRIAMRRRPHL